MLQNLCIQRLHPHANDLLVSLYSNPPCRFLKQRQYHVPLYNALRCKKPYKVYCNHMHHLLQHENTLHVIHAVYSHDPYNHNHKLRYVLKQPQKIFFRTNIPCILILSNFLCIYQRMH